MTQEIVLDVVRAGLLTVMQAAAPPLILGLSAGLIMAIFQTVTSIQEPTLAFIPKILAVLLSLLLFGPFIMSTLVEFFQYLVHNIPYFMMPRG